MSLPADVWYIIASFSSSLSISNLLYVCRDSYDGATFNNKNRALFPKLSYYQLECATHLLSCSNVFKNLAGPPGSGKTYIILSYIIEKWLKVTEPIFIFCRTRSLEKWKKLLKDYNIHENITIIDIDKSISLKNQCHILIDDGSFTLLDSASKPLVVDGIASCTRSKSHQHVYPCFWVPLYNKAPFAVRKVILDKPIPIMHNTTILIKTLDCVEDKNMDADAVVISLDYIQGSDKFYHHILDQENMFLRPSNKRDTVYIYYKVPGKHEAIFLNLFLSLREAKCTYPYALSTFMLNRINIHGTSEEVEKILLLSSDDIIKLHNYLENKNNNNIDASLYPFYQLLKPLFS